MASPLEALMALFQAKKPQPSQVRSDYGLTGAMISAQRSPYERTMAPGEQRSAQDLQSMLGEVILAAGAGASSVTGPRGVELARTAARVRPGGEAAFNKWFEGSKAVDPTGKPLTVYHGTDRPFDTFSGSAKKNWEDYSLPGGHYFTSSPKEAGAYAENAGANIKPAHLATKNPLVIKRNAPGWASTTIDMDRGAIMKELLRARKAGNPYDSVISESTDGTRTFVVFSPSQIKSATGNRGTYSPSSGDIRE